MMIKFLLYFAFVLQMKAKRKKQTIWSFQEAKREKMSANRFGIVKMGP